MSAPLDAGTEVFDNTRAWKQYEGSTRAVRLIGGAAGGVVLIVGVLLLIVFPLGAGHPTFGQKVVVPSALIVLGGGFLAISLLPKPREISGVEINDATVQFRFTDGRTVTGRWSDPAIQAFLSHGIRTPPADPSKEIGWVLAWRDAGARVSKVVTLEVGDALVRRARRLGLETTDSKREFSARGGMVRYESTRIRASPQSPR